MSGNANPELVEGPASLADAVVDIVNAAFDAGLRLG
jgi:hypothetical protein